jgi:A/G-specific adenine glycosylase
MVDDHDGRVPRTLAELLALPGVGEYTARAVLAFAFGDEVGVVDTNAGRILSRAVAGTALGRSQAQALVDAMVPAGRAWEFNQALLDLGATVCVRAAPRCGACPIRPRCRWDRTGRTGPDPAVGSAGDSGGQAAFAGSDRQGRGRLIGALRRGAVRAEDVAAAAGWPDDPDRADRVVAGLVEDGMVVRGTSGVLRLP